jgi:hypothetical protein
VRAFFRALKTERDVLEVGGGHSVLFLSWCHREDSFLVSCTTAIKRSSGNCAVNTGLLQTGDLLYSTKLIIQREAE